MSNTASKNKDLIKEMLSKELKKNNDLTWESLESIAIKIVRRVIGSQDEKTREVFEKIVIDTAESKFSSYITEELKMIDEEILKAEKEQEATQDATLKEVAEEKVKRLRAMRNELMEKINEKYIEKVRNTEKDLVDKKMSGNLSDQEIDERNKAKNTYDYQLKAIEAKEKEYEEQLKHIQAEIKEVSEMKEGLIRRKKELTRIINGMISSHKEKGLSQDEKAELSTYRQQYEAISENIKNLDKNMNERKSKLLELSSKKSRLEEDKAVNEQKGNQINDTVKRYREAFISEMAAKCVRSESNEETKQNLDEISKNKENILTEKQQKEKTIEELTVLIKNSLKVYCNNIFESTNSKKISNDEYFEKIVKNTKEALHKELCDFIVSSVPEGFDSEKIAGMLKNGKNVLDSEFVKKYNDSKEAIENLEKVSKEKDINLKELNQNYETYLNTQRKKGKFRSPKEVFNNWSSKSKLITDLRKLYPTFDEQLAKVENGEERDNLFNEYLAKYNDNLLKSKQFVNFVDSNRIYDKIEFFDEMNNIQDSEEFFERANEYLTQANKARTIKLQVSSVTKYMFEDNFKNCLNAKANVESAETAEEKEKAVNNYSIVEESVEISEQPKQLDESLENDDSKEALTVVYKDFYDDCISMLNSLPQDKDIEKLKGNIPKPDDLDKKDMKKQLTILLQIYEDLKAETQEIDGEEKNIKVVEISD